MGDWDWDCNHDTPARRSFESSIKGYIGANLCWGHTARDTFFVGKDGTYKFKTIELYYRTTEICAYTDTSCGPAECYAGSKNGIDILPSWPREGGMWCPKSGCPPTDPEEQAPWYIYVETSMDGTDWEIVGKALFGWVKGSQQETITLSSWKTFRFIRVRQPDDVAGKTLAGYLDSVGFNLPDLEKVEDEGTITVNEEPLQCDSTNSIDGIPIPDVGQKFLGMPSYLGVVRTEEQKICGDVGILTHKYSFAAGNEVVTWFAGWEKKWIVDKLEGNIKTCHFRSTYTKVRFVVQTSMDGITWKTITETDPSVYPDGEYTLTLKDDEPFEFRFLRIFTKPASWGSGGSISNAWIQDAVITQILPEICDWIDGQGGPGALTIEDIFVIMDSYLSEIPPEGYIFVPTLQNVFGVIDYYFGFNGDPLTGCNFFP